MKYFLAPVAATPALLIFWLWALTHHVNLGPTSHGPNSTSHAVAFNIVLVVMLALMWIGAYWLHDHRGNKRK